MLHSLLPAKFVPGQLLWTPSKCPECDREFTFAAGFMSLAHYCVLQTGEIKQGLMCFCSTSCLLHWEQPSMLGLMH
jgi:hypothetical protein